MGPQPAGGPTVLLVDDERDVLELTATFLERVDSGLDTLTATDAETGLATVEAEAVDCVVADYEMPECSGVEFCRQLREEYPTMPFILFTGKGSEEVASEALSAGVTDYLSKGGGREQYEQLANRIRNAAARGRAERADERLQADGPARVDAFADLLGDELAEPLAAAAHHIDQAAAACDCDRAADSLAAAAEAVDRAETYVEETVLLAREGDLIDETEPVLLADAVEQVWETLETDDATIEVGDLLTVEADPRRLRQLLEQVLTNAIKHGGPDVRVTVRATDRGFYIADDGPGIAPADRDRAFERGQAGADGGAGFGLAIVDHIAEAHGWSVALRASASGGTSVEVLGIERAD